MHKLNKYRPIIYGEVLFDCFPDGSAVLGGAPFNVAWHLQGLGLNPLMITAVGDDPNGTKVIDTMEHWGMDTTCVQLKTGLPTGSVDVKFDAGEPSYDIVKNRAYDNITDHNLETEIGDNQISLVYHGSLIMREKLSRETLVSIIKFLNVPIFVDINLRSPWWNLADIQSMLPATQYVKLNVHELAEISSTKSIADDQVQDVAKRIFDLYKMDLLIVTLGADGAFFVTIDGIVEGVPAVVDNLVDTVGAGDSFSAVIITGLLLKWPWAVTLTRALEFSAAICGIRGATTTDGALYQSFLEKWRI